MKIHKINSKAQKTRKRAVDDLDQYKKTKDKKQNDQYTVRSMLDDLNKWDDFLS